MFFNSFVPPQHQDFPSIETLPIRGQPLKNIKNPFRSTAYTFRKTIQKAKEDSISLQNTIEPNSLREIHQKTVSPKKLNYHSPQFRATSFHSSQSPEKACTSFMKNYVDKLKKQRKRINRKQNQSNHHKSAACQLSPITSHIPQTNYMSKHHQMLILEKIPNITLGFSMLKSNHSASIDSSPSKHILDNQKIVQIINEIKSSRKQLKDPQKIVQSATQQILPFLKPIKKSNKKEKLIKFTKHSQKNLRPLIFQSFNHRSIAPWQNQQGVQQFSIQQYR